MFSELSGHSGVARWEPRGPEQLWNLAEKLTLSEPGWVDFAPHTTASPPGFKIAGFFYISQHFLMMHGIMSMIAGSSTSSNIFLCVL